MFRRFLFALRRWGLEWAGILSAPFRMLRPRAIRSEVVLGGRDVLSVSGGVVRGVAATIAGFIVLVLWLPVLVGRFLIYDGPRWVIGWLHWNSSRRVAAVVAIGLGLCAVLGGTALYTWSERRLDFRRTLYWRQLDYHLQNADIEKVEQTLVELERLGPAHGAATHWLEAIRARQTSSFEPKIVRLLMRTHYRENHIDLAAKEARTLLRDAPADWEALCFLAHDAHNRGDQNAVREFLADLPRANDVPNDIALWAARYSLVLFQMLGETARYDEMVEFVVLHYLPLLRDKQIEFTDPAVKLILLDGYHHAVQQLERWPKLTQYWVALRQVSQSLLGSESIAVPELVRLGQLMEFQIVYLHAFVRLKHITENERQSMTAEVEDSLTVLWKRVLTLEPRNAAAYMGLSLQRYRAGDAADAVRVTDDGLRVCGTRPELVAFKTRFLRTVDPQAGLAFIESAIGQVEMTPAMCEIWAEAALAAGRLDKARDACDQALKTDAKLIWPHRALAEIHMRLGFATRAVAALEPLKHLLVNDPEACKLYVRALCSCGAYPLAEEFLSEMHADQRPPEVLLEAAKGLHQADRHEDAVRWVEQVLKRDPNNVAALLIHADCLRVLAEVGDRDWDRDKVRGAIRSYRAILTLQKNVSVVNNIVWLELKALNNPKEAYEDAAPLRAVQNDEYMSAEFLETLGAVSIANGQYEEGRKMLLRAVSTGGPRSSFYCHLALAHQGLKQPEKAEEYLAMAAQYQKKPREQAEYFDISRAVRQGR